VTMVNAVMLVRDRLELTRQAIFTMLDHVPVGSLNLTIADDGSQDETRFLLERFANDRVRVLRLFPPVGIVGLARNLGILASERLFGRGDYLYLADNDAYHLPGWLDTLRGAFERAEPHVKLLGGYTHPYHGVNQWAPASSPRIGLHDAVQGLSQLMRWNTFDRYGPFDSNAQGTNQSEDFAFCQRIIKDSYLVGSIYPRVIINCGLLDSYGKPCVGYEAVQAELEAEIRARGLEGKVYYPTVGEKASA